jgi:DNA-binding NarL/FixJ family response regulator
VYSETPRPKLLQRAPLDRVSATHATSSLTNNHIDATAAVRHAELTLYPKSHITVAIGEFGELVKRGLIEVFTKDQTLRLVTMPQRDTHRRQWPNAIVIDGDRSQPSAAEGLRAVIPSIGIIVLANSAARIRRIRGLDTLTTCLLKEDTSVSELLTAVQLAVFLAGQRSADLSPTPAAHPSVEALALTNREREVMACVAEGLTHRAIAQRFTISIETARTHTAHIRSKLGVNSNRQLIAIATRLGGTS